MGSKRTLKRRRQRRASRARAWAAVPANSLFVKAALQAMKNQLGFCRHVNRAFDMSGA